MFELDLMSFVLHGIVGALLYVGTVAVTAYYADWKSKRHNVGKTYMQKMACASLYYGFIIATLAGVLKEVYDYLDYGVFNFFDILHTIQGAALGTVIVVAVAFILKHRENNGS